MTVKRRRVFLLDDDEDLRDSLCDLATLLGSSCLALSSVAAMMAAERDVLACDVAVLDVNLGDMEPTGVDAYEWLRARAFAGPILFLTGHAASNPAVKRAAALGARVLAKPVDTDLFSRLIGQ